MPIQLIVTNISFAFSLVVSLGLAIFVFIRRPQKDYSINIIFLLLSISTSIWMVSYVLGINLHNPEYSRLAFMFNLATLPLAVLGTHVILIITKRLAGQEKIINIFYTIAIVLILYFVLFPSTFMLPSLPKLYLPNFFVPGPLYFIQDIFFFAVTIYILVQIMIGYRRSDYRTKNQLKYFIFGFIYGYVISLVPEFLLYDIPVDPMPAAFMGLYTIPMAYAILKYDLIDINFLAKRALGYALGITSVTLLILFTGYANTTVHYLLPNFPNWLLPLFSAIIAVIVGVFVWQKVKEVNILKYRFVDVVTHKFRTPLTYIHWSLETLRTKDTTEEDRNKALVAIADAYTRLSELTDTLIGLSSSDDSQFMYSYKKYNIKDLISEVINASSGRIKEKDIHIDIASPGDFPDVFVDNKKLIFAIQMVFDNAITYSNNGGKVDINIEKKHGFAIMSVRDFGIGITEIDLSRLFNKFFRGTNAIHAHTEGLGIGLYLARDIARRQGGDLKVWSEGEGKGSTFTFKIPLVIA